MKLAVNYSPQAAALLDAGVVAFDLYKCTEWPEMIEVARRQRPPYVHLPLMAGRDNIAEVGWDTIYRALDTTETPFINTHLAPRGADFGVPLDSTDVAQGEVLLAAMLRDIAPLTQRLGAGRVILENANWDPNYDIPQLVIAPTFINRVVEASGCGLLLDLAHARMAATHLGMDDRQYVSQLPVHRLRELHVAGTRYDPGERRLVDHFPMTANDWVLAEWALERIHAGDWPQPALVALEYGGTGPAFAWRSEAGVLATDLPRLHSLVHGLRVH